VSESEPLGHAQIRTYLLEVADALPAGGPQQLIVVVGGALLAWHGLRATTRDVDVVQRLDAELRDAVLVVAERHGLAPRWLNDDASRFVPRTLDVAECEVLGDHPRLRVLGAPLQQVFLMKMFSARAPDRDDLVAIWPHLGLTPEQVVEGFWEAYPAAPPDEYLLAWISDIAAESEAERS
jgi:hypothetical protein